MSVFWERSTIRCQGSRERNATKVYAVQELEEQPLVAMILIESNFETIDRMYGEVVDIGSEVKGNTHTHSSKISGCRQALKYCSKTSGSFPFKSSM